MKVASLLWDEANITHVARHAVTLAEVEHVVFGVRTLAPMESTGHRDSRLVFFGVTDGGRHLAVVVDRPSPAGAAYVVSARPMSDRERRQYEERADG